ncbi:MAG: hypothetical protein ACYDBJ_03685 [Aggregatilineales bacterium]
MVTSPDSDAEHSVGTLHLYRVEPVRPALILIVVEAAIALLIPNVAWREFVLLWISGPALWAVLQIARRNSGVTVYADRLAVQSSLTRRVTNVPFDYLLGDWVTPNRRLALAFHQPRPMLSGDPDARPPRLRLYVTAPLADSGMLITALPSNHKLTSEQVRKMFRMRRTRRSLYLILALLIGMPLLMLLLFRVAFSIGLGVSF